MEESDMTEMKCIEMATIRAELHQPDDDATVDGFSNPAFIGSTEPVDGLLAQGLFDEEESRVDDSPPPLTYVDFLPKCLDIGSKESPPVFENFKTVVELVNQWLECNEDFMAWKCEMMEKKITPGQRSNFDSVLHHESSYGQNTYVRGLRIWLVPKPLACLPCQKIGYETLLPGYKSLEEAKSKNPVQAFVKDFQKRPNMAYPSFNTLTLTIERYNRQLMAKPLPGRILNVEAFYMRCADNFHSENFNPEFSSWTEIGKCTRLYVTAIRVFYVHGKSAYETIGLQNIVPAMKQKPDDFGHGARFEQFDQVISKAGDWIKQKLKARIVNIQSMVVKCESSQGGQLEKLADNSDIVEVSFVTTQFFRILRIFYVDLPRTADVIKCPPVSLKSRLFLPVRLENDFESFSKTVQRVIQWLKETGNPVYAIETTSYPWTRVSTSSGINDKRCEVIINRNQGRYHLCAIRLYFAGEFKELPPILNPPNVEDGSYWACVIQ